MPGILTYRDPQGPPVDVYRDPFFPGDEIALFVEHTEVRELDLAIHGFDGARAKEPRSVMQTDIGALDETRDDRAYAGRFACQLDKRVLVVAHELRAKNQVLRRVARDSQLGEADQVGALTAGAGRPLRHPRDVAVEIADGRVQLAERDADHVSSLTPEEPSE